MIQKVIQKVSWVIGYSSHTINRKKEDTNKTSNKMGTRVHYQYFIYHDLMTQGYWFALILIHTLQVLNFLVSLEQIQPSTHGELPAVFMCKSELHSLSKFVSEQGRHILFELSKFIVQIK